MKVVLAGGTGHLGSLLANGLRQKGHEIVTLSRGEPNLEKRIVHWHGETGGPWELELDGCDVLINLAGRSVNCRYNARNRREILDSRIRSTRVLGEAVARAARPPGVWLQSSTATIYSHRLDAPNDEFEGVLGGSEPNVPDTWRFSIEVARGWEHALDEANTPSTRKVAMRTAIVMSPTRNGPFDVLLSLVRKGLGGKSGDGRQFISWVHDHDFVEAVSFLMERPDLSGPVNIASPNPLPNAEFMRLLRRAAGVRFGLATPRWMLEIGAFFLRTETELVLKSRRVVPTRLLQAGFDFRFPEWRSACEDLVARRRADAADA